MLVISGLPGTGKTTLCKKVAKELNYDYASDWQIFNQNNIAIDRLQDKFEVSKQYSKIVLDYILANKDKNIILDLEYSVSPQDFAEGSVLDNESIIYLGFVSVGEDILFNLFKQKLDNISVTDDGLKTQIAFYKEMSKKFFNQCQELNIKYVDINKDKKEILTEIYNSIKK